MYYTYGVRLESRGLLEIFQQR